MDGMDEERRGLERRMTQVEAAIARFGSDINDIKTRQELQKQVNEIQFRGIDSKLETIAEKIDVSNRKVDELELVRASIIGAMNLIKWVGVTGIITLFVWMIKFIVGTKIP